MATKNAATVAQTSEFDEPDHEFSVPNDSVSRNTPSEASGSLSLDQLNSVGFDENRDEEEFAKLNPPTGDWKKDDRWPFAQKDIRVNQEDSVPGDMNPIGRTTFNFAGKPMARQANGVEYQPVLFLRISPDIRRKKDKPDEVDMAYKLFLKAKDMYITLHGERASNMGQLKDMLEEDSYILRTMNGDGGPVVVDIKIERKVR